MIFFPALQHLFSLGYGCVQDALIFDPTLFAMLLNLGHKPGHIYSEVSPIVAGDVD